MRKFVKVEQWLLFTLHYSARCFGMNIPKSRDIPCEIFLISAHDSQVDIPSAVCYTKNHISDKGTGNMKKEKNYNFIYYDNCDCLTP